MLAVAVCLAAPLQLAAARHRPTATPAHRVHRHAVAHRRPRGTRRHERQTRKRSLLARAEAHVKRERAAVVSFARRFLGVRYVYGGSTPGSGFDCSGFTRYVFAHFGHALPHYSYGQFDLGRSVPRRALRPGDLVFFDGAGHVGLYIGPDRFIHAPHSGSTVSVAALSGSYGGSFAGARRILQ